MCILCLVIIILHSIENLYSHDYCEVLHTIWVNKVWKLELLNDTPKAQILHFQHQTIELCIVYSWLYFLRDSLLADFVVHDTECIFMSKNGYDSPGDKILWDYIIHAVH